MTDSTEDRPVITLAIAQAIARFNPGRSCGGTDGCYSSHLLLMPSHGQAEKEDAVAAWYAGLDPTQQAAVIAGAAGIVAAEETQRAIDALLATIQPELDRLLARRDEHRTSANAVLGLVLAQTAHAEAEARRRADAEQNATYREQQRRERGSRMRATRARTQARNA